MRIGLPCAFAHLRICVVSILLSRIDPVFKDVIFRTFSKRNVNSANPTTVKRKANRKPRQVV